MPETIYVAGYGSLMSKRGLQRTLPDKEITCRATLKGWRRSFDHTGVSHRYGTLVPDETAKAKHIALIQVNQEEFEAIKSRERGYKEVDVTANIDPKPPGGDVVVIAFVALTPAEKPVRRSYMNTVLEDLSPEEQEEVLQDIDFCGAEIDENG